MGRFSDQPLIDSANITSGDIMPITDVQNPAADNKITLGQLSEFVESQDSTISGNKTFSGDIIAQGDLTIESVSTGLLKTAYGKVLNAVAGTDFLAPGVAGNGSSLTSLNASNISSGTIASARLPLSGVTAGSYTTTDLTVDNYGRITSITSGSGSGGVNIFDNKGTVTTNITLAENKITTAYFSGTNTITLPTVTDTTKQVTCELWFTTASSGQPTITNSNLKWDKTNNGHAPSFYSVATGVVNVLIFKSYWEGSTLKWATEYKTNGAVETDFVRPYLTANGTLGGASVAVSATTERASYPAWQGSDVSTSTSFQFTTTSGDFIYYVPNAVKAEQLYILDNTSVTSPCVQTMSIYGSKGGSTYTYLTNYTHVNGGSYITIPTELRDYWNYFKLSISAPSVSYAGFFDFYPIGKYLIT